jgi:small-conductance mechanosensitive channel
MTEPANDTKNQPPPATAGANAASGAVRRGRTLLVCISAAVLAACLLASYLTRGAMANLPFLRGQTSSELVDQKPWQTVAALAPLATSAEEQALAREAERLADHEVDQAFAMALRQAEMDQSQALTGPALTLQQKVNGLAAQVKQDQADVNALNAKIAAAAKTGAADTSSDDLDVAKARLQLDTDEWNDANDDLTRASGDKRSEIQQELTAREASMQKYDSQANNGEPAAVGAPKRYGTLAGRINGWFEQRTREGLVTQAKSQTDAEVASLTAEHAALDARSDATTAKIKEAGGASGTSGAAAGDPAAQARLARITRAHSLAQIHTILEDRLDTEKQLSAVYARWSAQVALQHRIVMHLILQSLAVIAALVLGAVLFWWMVQTLLDRMASTSGTGSGFDRRSVHTLRTVASLAIQLVTLLLVLLIVFGTPSQMPTILGLGAAGLTVVFQDFILAFFGWFVLMGRNGIRIGDWVEINGVGGEVVALGLFRTGLLETGNWTDKGHPTGRRVTFMNSFAITGQFFNFSTSGQWMWDEISMNVPAGEGTYKTIEAIHSAVLTQTEQDAKLAEGEWKGAAKLHELGQFSAAPSVDMRPAASGIDIIVRYVTRAGDRFEVRNRLYQTVLKLLHDPSAAIAAPQDPAAAIPTSAPH